MTVSEIRMFSLSSNSTCDSITYDPVKPRLLELEAEMEEPTNGDAWNRALRLPYSFACACNPDNLVSTTYKQQSNCYKQNWCSASDKILSLCTSDDNSNSGSLVKNSL